jgi:hypothetical protein
VLNLDDWITTAEFVWHLVLSSQLLVVSGFDVPSMVLVEVVKLVVNVDGECDGVLYFLTERNLALLIFTQLVYAGFVVSHLHLGDLVGHHVEHDSDGQEDDTEDTEGEHGAHGGGHWSPGWKGLLLELRLLQLFNLLSDSLFLVWRYVHL